MSAGKSTSSTSGLMAGLQKIGDDVFFYEPGELQTNSKHKGPALVVLCVWTGGATPRRVGKYVNLYQTLYPHAAILVIRSTVPDLTLRSFASIHARLGPARDVINKVTARPDGRNQVLLHVFSNGGSNIAVQLVLSMQNAGVMLPLTKVVIDCAPAHARFSNMYRAATTSLPPNGGVYQLLVRTALVPVVGAVTAIQNTGLVVSSRYIQQHLNDADVFGPHVQRLYLYSRADEVVPPGDVEWHIADARAKGFEVQSVVFENAPHCGIIAKHEARYTAAIASFWSDMAQSKPIAISMTQPAQRGSGIAKASRLASKL